MVKLSELLGAESVFKYEFIEKDAFVNGGKTDSRQVVEGDIYFALKGLNSDGHDFIDQVCEKQAAAAVVNKNYNNINKFPVIYSENVEKTLGEFAMIWRCLHNAKIIGITGTNGKTTTKEMLARMLSGKYRLISTFKNYNNQIGVPLTLLSIKDDTEIAIVELGTNHFGEIKYLSDLSDPEYGIITNIGEGHLEYLIDTQSVYNEKKILFEHVLKRDGKIFVNTDDEYLNNWNKGNVITFGTSQKADYKFENIEIDGKGFPSFDFMGKRVTMNVPGSLNLKNALAAAVIAYEMKVELPYIISALKTFSSSDKRYEMTEYKNSEVLLDCYNANPTSMELFLKDVSLMSKDYIVILGDMLELGITSQKSHVKVVELASQLNFREVLLYGNEMKSAFTWIKFDPSVKHYEKFEELKKMFDKLAEDGRKIAVKGSRGMKLEKLLEDIE
ncbi:MAG: UDP-N-acetylmuramoyl-tripeptide--D-alanyl-D-alanine ligase [Candidatus Delongbacteria bacterium]|nr:UDP-N-acetylmuramoyl-tripeptide--D-alanyl-D-alanine ligase [Candidatus Delongbacteria bacterium]MCG2760628.1 UDP-N-acetylmuramoyl-tripeptide--D-alanyl-D-alanine ligase [Candidatus Delongbacteria bacterium]